MFVHSAEENAVLKGKSHERRPFQGSVKAFSLPWPRCIESGYAITCTLPPENSTQIHLEPFGVYAHHWDQCGLLQKESKQCQYCVYTFPSLFSGSRTADCDLLLPGSQESSLPLLPAVRVKGDCHSAGSAWA